MIIFIQYMCYLRQYANYHPNYHEDMILYLKVYFKNIFIKNKDNYDI